MARTNRRTNKTRSNRIDSAFNDGHPRRAKFLPDEDNLVHTEHYTQQALPQFTPANERQRTALRYLTEGRSLVFLTGTFGTGKSMIAAYHAARLLKQKKVEKVYLIRPNVHCGKSVGMLKGTLSEKLEPFFAQTVAHLEFFMGKGFTKYALDKKIVEYVAVEYLRGLSFENAVCIFEESQGLTHEEFETCLSRLGNNAQFCFTGDFKQVDNNVKSGLNSTLAMLDKVLDDEPAYLNDDDLDLLAKNIGVVVFQPEDVVRSGVGRALAKIYYHN